MSEELIQRVIATIAKCQKLEPEKVTIDSTFEELGIDSLDGVNIVFELENEFNISIPDEAAQSVRSVRQIVESIEKVLEGGAPQTAPAPRS